MYENYVLQSIASGLDLKTLEVWEPDFTFSREDLERLYSPRTRAVLLCNPSNPTGKVFRREELQTVVDFARAHDLLIFSDETYEYLVWPGHEHVSIASLPGAGDITVTCTSMGKTYSVTGWRVGYLVAEESLTDELRKMHDFFTVTAPHPFQIALAKAMTDLPQSFYDRARAEYWARKQILCEALTQTGITWYEPGGSYFLWCDYSKISSLDDTQFSERLLHEAGVAGVAGSVFYPFTTKNPKRLRFTYSKARATMEAAAGRLRKFAETRVAVS
jgi:aminotransferase